MLNMDFSKNLVIETQQLSWESSPMPGVNRKRLAYEEVEQGCRIFVKLHQFQPEDTQRVTIDTENTA